MQQDRSLKGKDKAQSYQFMLRLKVRCGLHSCQAHQPGNGHASSCAALSPLQCDPHCGTALIASTRTPCITAYCH